MTFFDFHIRVFVDNLRFCIFVVKLSKVEFRKKEQKEVLYLKIYWVYKHVFAKMVLLFLFEIGRHKCIERSKERMLLNWRFLRVVYREKIALSRQNRLKLAPIGWRTSLGMWAFSLIPRDSIIQILIANVMQHRKF